MSDTRVPGSEETIEMMVNCKTYPAVSKKYTETVCTGAVTPDGKFVRLYPVPFRFLDSTDQYDRWERIRVKVYQDTKDVRPETRHYEPGTPIVKLGMVNSEKERWQWMRPVVYPSREAMGILGITNGLVEIKPLELYYEGDEKEWTAEQKEVFRQGDLFATKEQMESLCERVPFQFRLKYQELGTGVEGDGKILAWSYYQGYRRAYSDLKSQQGALDAVANRVRASIFNPEKSVFAIFGTHRAYGTWLISALYHLPREIREQGGMF